VIGKADETTRNNDLICRPDQIPGYTYGYRLRWRHALRLHDLKQLKQAVPSR
jgi:hypothetical protein